MKIVFEAFPKQQLLVMGLSALLALAVNVRGADAQVTMWYQSGAFGLVRADVEADGSTVTFSESTIVPDTTITAGGAYGITELLDGSLLACMGSGAGPFTMHCVHIPTPPAPGELTTAATDLGLFPSGIGFEGLYTDCDGRLYAVDTGTTNVTAVGNRLLRFTGDVLSGDYSFEEIVSLAAVGDIDDLGPGIDDAGRVTDNPGFMIDTTTVFTIHYLTGSSGLVGTSGGRWGIHAVDRSRFSDGESRVFVLNNDGALRRADPDTAATLETLGTGPGTAAIYLTGALGTCVSAIPPTCGDDTVNLAEECDGTDDSACPGECIAAGETNECTCSTGPGGNGGCSGFPAGGYEKKSSPMPRIIVGVAFGPTPLPRRGRALAAEDETDTWRIRAVTNTKDSPTDVEAYFGGCVGDGPVVECSSAPIVGIDFASDEFDLGVDTEEPSEARFHLGPSWTYNAKRRLAKYRGGCALRSGGTCNGRMRVAITPKKTKIIARTIAPSAPLLTAPSASPPPLPRVATTIRGGSTSGQCPTPKAECSQFTESCNSKDTSGGVRVVCKKGQPSVDCPPLPSISTTTSTTSTTTSSTTTSSTSTTLPPPCGVGSKCAFVTSADFDANLGGIAGANAACQTAANAGLGFVQGGTYRAWISDSASGPATNFTQSTVPYRLANGTKIADNWTDLTDTTIDALINISELGTSRTRQAWTNTTASGTPWNPNGDTNLDTCAEWTSTTANRGYIGNAGVLTDSGWTQLGFVGCPSTIALYCSEQ